VRLIGPAKNLIIHDCLFFGPGRYEHRSSRDRHRTNMLAGLCLQPSGWDRTEGTVDQVHVANVTMHDVASPLHLSAKPPSTVGRVTVDRLTATGVYRAAASIESWADEPIGHVSLRDVSIECIGGGTAAQAAAEVRAPGVDVRPLPAWGLYARRVKSLEMANVRFSLQNDDARPAFLADGIDVLDLGALAFPSISSKPLDLRRVTTIRDSTTKRVVPAAATQPNP
jgi:hypothetical protein